MIDLKKIKEALADKGYSPEEINKVTKEITKGLKNSAEKGNDKIVDDIKDIDLKKLAGSVAGGFYDRYASAQGRISTETVKSIFKELQGDLSWNPISLIGNVLESLMKGGFTLLEVFGKVQDNILEKTTTSGGYLASINKSMIDELNEALITSAKMGVTVENFLSSTKDIVEATGRMTLYSQSTLEDIIQTSQAFGTSSKFISENLEKFIDVGLSLGDTSKIVEKIGLSSVRLGLNAKTTTTLITNNISKLNSYGFKNGIEGLGKMVQQAQQLNIDISDTLRLSEQFYDVDKALDLSANLQVLGGAFGDLANPLKLVYDATNDVNSLQDSILESARSLATYNTQLGRFEVVGLNLRRAKELSDILGISMENLTNTAVKTATRFEALSKVKMLPQIDRNDKELIDFVANLSSIKNGVIGFDLPKDIQKQMGLKDLKDNFIGLDMLNTEQIKAIVDLKTELQSLDTKDIALEQYNTITQLMSIVSGIYLQLQNNVRKQTFVKEGDTEMRRLNKYLLNQDTNKLLNELTNVAKENIQKVIPKDFKGIFDGLSKKIQETVPQIINKGEIKPNNFNLDSAIEKIKKIPDLMNKGDKTGKTEIIHKFQAPPLLDPFLREVFRNPDILSDAMSKDDRSYV